MLLVCAHLLTVQPDILFLLPGSCSQELHRVVIPVYRPPKRRPQTGFSLGFRVTTGSTPLWSCWPGFPAPPHKLSHRLQLSLLPNLCPWLKMISERLSNFTKTKNFSVTALKILSWTVVGVNWAFFICDSVDHSECNSSKLATKE